MFKEFLRLWRREGLLKLAAQEVEEMLSTARTMFENSLKSVMEETAVTPNIYQIDQGLNRLQIDVRKKLLEHLSVNPRQDLTACLILSTIVGDVERIGDYSKNLVELVHLYPYRLEGPYIERIRRLGEEILGEFDKTLTAFKAGDAQLGRAVMERHARIAPNCEQLVEELVCDPGISARTGIICALLARYLKRVSAHLKNVASSVVNPYHRLGYRPQG